MAHDLMKLIAMRVGKPSARARTTPVRVVVNGRLHDVDRVTVGTNGVLIHVDSTPLAPARRT